MLSDVTGILANFLSGIISYSYVSLCALGSNAVFANSHLSGALNSIFVVALPSL